ncbi:hypothetical protein [Pseudonocardia xishanensis]|uniref:Cell division protein FtsL n=1 Tax=Pseudonocardia xishanensis TaxID=630995 RepID=A0ABP8RT38_9PSEU
MSAPVKTPTPTRRRPKVSVEWHGTETRDRRVPAQRGSVTVPAQRKASAAAYAKRDERARRAVGGPRRKVAQVAHSGRAQFVLLIMALFTAGLVLTLWLSTAAAADSYTLQEARTAARDLTEQSERLHREVAALESAPALAQRATDLGMVPVQDPARLVVAPDGAVTVVGQPTAAVRKAPPAAPVTAPPAAAPAPAPADAQAPTAATDPAAQAAAPPATDPAAPATAAQSTDPAAQGADPAQAAGEAATQQQAQAEADRLAARNPAQPGGA